MAAPSDDDVPRIDAIKLNVSNPLKVKEDCERQLDILIRQFGRDYFVVADCYSLLGVVHQQLRSLQQAKECHENALDIRIKLLGRDHTHVADSYNQLGVGHQMMGELQQAKECHENALDIHIKLLGPDHTDVADSHYELGVLHQKMGDLQRAKECHERALGIRVEKLGHDHTGVAGSYNQLGVIHQKMGDLQQAKECHERALDIRVKLLGHDHTDVAASYDQLGVVHQTTGELQQAKEYYERALDIRLKRPGRHHTDVAASYDQLGVVHKQLGDLQQAEQYHERATMIRIEPPEHDDTDDADFCDQLGVLHEKMGNLQGAKQYHKRALDIRLKLLGLDHTDVAGSYNQLGVVHQKMGMLQQAKQYYERALDIIIKQLGSHHTDVAHSYNQLGVVHQEIGDLQKAKQYYERALDIFVEKLEHDNTNVADSYNQLGTVHQKIGDLPQAKECHERALDIRIKLLGHDHTDVADSYNQLGVVHQMMGELQQAKECHERTLDIRIKLLGRDHTEVANSYNQLGVVHQQMDDLLQALKYYERALAIRIILLGSDHSDVAASYNQLGVANQDFGDLKQAKKCHKHALNIRVKLFGTDSMDVSYSYNSLSSVYRHLGDRKKANQLYERAQAIREKLGHTVRADDQPDDILYNNAYHRALNAGEANNTRIPIMIVGQDRAGKTSLKNHLLGLPFDNQEPSTNGIDVDVVELTDKNAEDPWKRKEVKQFMMSEKETKKQIFKQAAQFSSEQQASPEVSKESNSSNQAEDVNKSVKPSLSRAEIDDIKSLEKDASDELPPIRVFVHDLAGQDIYHDTHYYFLKLKCPCVVVHDLRKPFGNPAQPRFKASRIDVDRNLNNPLLATNRDYFLSWLDVLARLGDSASNVGSNESLTFKLPPVIIVLTNSDRFEGNIDEVKNRIKDILIEKGFENVFTEFYIVDSSSSGEGKDEVRKLRWKLYCLCKDILDVQRPVPIRWLQFESSLSNKMVAEQLPYIPVEVAHEIGKVCDVENVDAAISFLHQQGVIVHHVGSPVVVLNPQWLMNVFAEIITVLQEDIPCDALHRKRMTKEGILMQEYLEKKGHGKVLEMLMVQFGLICPWEHEGKPAFIVPSVAPLMEQGEDVQKQLSASPIASVFFKFQRGHVLPGLFTRFLVGMINKCREFLRSRRPQLFCNYALLSFQHSGGKFDVYIIKQLAGIKIGVVPRATLSQHVMFASYLKASMVDCIKSIKDAERLFYWNIDASLNVKCSVCFGENQLCLRHDKDKCEHDDCGHFWPLDELQGTNHEDPICDYASAVGTEEFPLEDAKPWISVDNLNTFSHTECCSLTNAGENEPSCSSPLTQADQPTSLPVLELSISNLQLLKRQKICKLLDVKHPVAGDFRELARCFEMSRNDLDLISQEPCPTDAILNWAARRCGNTIGKLLEILSSMGRDDCVKIIDDYYESGGTSTSS